MGALGQLLEAAAAGAIPRPSLLLVEAQDRFGRRPPLETLQRIFGQCLDNGLDIYLLNRDLHITAETVNTDVSVLIRLALEIDTAHRYSEQLSKRMRLAHEEGRKKQARGEIARAGWAPEWIDLVDEQGAVISGNATHGLKSAGVRWQLNGKASTVRRVIELAEQGHGQSAIAKRLNADGIPPLRGSRSKANDGEAVRSVWQPGMVDHLLQSPAVAGGRELKRRTGQVVWDYFPPVIDRPRWEALRLLLSSRATNQTAGPQRLIRYIGQGCTVCADCGRPFGYRSTSNVTRGQRVVTEYIRCRGRVAGVCNAPMLRLQPVVAHLLTRLSAEHLGSLFPDQQDDQAAATITAKIDQLQREADEARAMAAAAEREMSKALGNEPALAAVLGRQVVLHEQRAVDLTREVEATRHQLGQLCNDQHAAAIKDLSNRVAAFLQGFTALDDDDARLADRAAVNGLLRRLGVRIVVDASRERIGMAVGTADLDWQPLDASISGLALLWGLSNTTYRHYQGRGVAAVVPLASAPDHLVTELTDQAIAHLLRRSVDQ